MLDTAVAEQRIVGGVLLVARDGTVVYERAAGLADREARRAMTTDTAFRLASMTKPIVTVAAMRLVDQGKLHLDDPVTRYLPDFKPKLADGSTPAPQSRGTLQWGGVYGHTWFVDPQRKLTMILLTNTTPEGMAGPLVTQVRDAVYGNAATS